MINTCSTCRWWNDKNLPTMEPFTIPRFPSDPNKDPVPAGRCQRHAPSGTGWDMTREDDWCGDYEVILDKK